MIEAFTIQTAHLYQDAFASQARLRHDVFVRQRELDHESFNGLEFDEFDSPSAVYLVWRDQERIVRGMARMLRTTRRYMLASNWPEMVLERPLPSTPSVWEVTRVCVDKTLEPMVRRTVFPELLCAIQEFLVEETADGMIGVTSEALLSHFIREGIQWLGPPMIVEGRLERAFFVPVRAIRPHRHCELYGIGRKVMAQNMAEASRVA